MSDPTTLDILADMTDRYPAMVTGLASFLVLGVARFAMVARAGLFSKQRPVSGGPLKTDYFSVPGWTALRYTYSGQHRAARDGVLTALVWLNRLLPVVFLAIFGAILVGLLQK